MNTSKFGLEIFLQKNSPTERTHIIISDQESMSNTNFNQANRKSEHGHDNEFKRSRPLTWFRDKPV